MNRGKLKNRIAELETDLHKERKQNSACANASGAMAKEMQVQIIGADSAIAALEMELNETKAREAKLRAALKDLLVMIQKGPAFEHLRMQWSDTIHRAEAVLAPTVTDNPNCEACQNGDHWKCDGKDCECKCDGSASFYGEPRERPDADQT